MTIKSGTKLLHLGLNWRCSAHATSQAERDLLSTSNPANQMYCFGCIPSNCCISRDWRSKVHVTWRDSTLVSFFLAASLSRCFLVQPSVRDPLVYEVNLCCGSWYFSLRRTAHVSPLKPKSSLLRGSRSLGGCRGRRTMSSGLFGAGYLGTPWVRCCWARRFEGYPYIILQALMGSNRFSTTKLVYSLINSGSKSHLLDINPGEDSVTR